MMAKTRFLPGSRPVTRLLLRNVLCLRLEAPLGAGWLNCTLKEKVEVRGGTGNDSLEGSMMLHT